MCRISSIQMLTMVLNYFKGFIGVLVGMVGLSFVIDINLHEAFTTQFKEYGGALIFLGFLSWVSVMCQSWATNRHNRFMLVLCFCMDSIVLGAQYHLGITVTSYTYPDFPSELQLDCLRSVPQVYTSDECSPYIESDRVSGMRLYWEYYYADRETRSSFQKITSIEGDLCCGFFAPLGCVENSNLFPSNRDVSSIDITLSVNGVSFFLPSQRVVCGDQPQLGYYPATDECFMYSDLSTVPPTVGGCAFDMGLGYCLDKPLTDSSLGCASFVEDTMKANIETTGFLLVFFTFFNVLAMLLECCMWWKRKEIDVLPRANVGGILKNVDYHMVRNQFEIKPQYEILAKRKFLPMPRHLKLELARQAEEDAALVAARLKEEEGFQDEV